MSDPEDFKITPPPVDPNEPRDARLKRLKMRSMRRGIKEMDLILSAFADAEIANMPDTDLDIYDSLLHENDHDLYSWVTGQVASPDQFATMIDRISLSFRGK